MGLPAKSPEPSGRCSLCTSCHPWILWGPQGRTRKQGVAAGGLGRNEERGRMSELLQSPEPRRQRGVCAGPGACGLFEEDRFHVAGLWRVGERESWGDIERNPQKQSPDIYPRPHCWPVDGGRHGDKGHKLTEEKHRGRQGSSGHEAGLLSMGRLGKPHISAPGRSAGNQSDS